MSATTMDVRGPAAIDTTEATRIAQSDTVLTPRFYTTDFDELDKIDRSIDELTMCSMIWFTITDQETDMSDQGKLTNILAGTADQVTQSLVDLKNAGMDMPLLWPPFADVPVSKTLEDLRQLHEDIIPQVNAA